MRLDFNNENAKIKLFYPHMRDNVEPETDC